MGFVLPELVVESIIRDGLANLRKRPDLVDDVFSNLLKSYAARKYGERELSKIKTLILEKEVAVVFSYHEVEAQVPCFSIMIGEDIDDKPTASLGDYRQSVEEDITDPDALAALVHVDSASVVSYDVLSGEVVLANGTDLSQVTKNNLLVDAEGQEHTIKAVVDEASRKVVFIASEAVLEPGDNVAIKSSLNYKKYEVNGVLSNVKLVVGVHTKDALTTKYLYILLKYIMLSRKQDLIKRDLLVSSYSGSDFTRDMQYAGDRVFTRFLTITAKSEDSWKQSEVTLIEDIQPVVLVDKAPGLNPQTTESLGREDQTIQIADDDPDPPSM